MLKPWQFYLKTLMDSVPGGRGHLRCDGGVQRHDGICSLLPQRAEDHQSVSKEGRQDDRKLQGAGGSQRHGDDHRWEVFEKRISKKLNVLLFKDSIVNINVFWTMRAGLCSVLLTKWVFAAVILSSSSAVL